MSDETPVEELSGRELDAAVHIEVMGWDAGDVDVEGMYGTTFNHDVDGRSFQVVPPYSTDIAAAWEVVERLASDGLYISLCDNRHGCYRLNGDSVSGFWVEIVRHDAADDYPTEHVRGLQAPTAPEAICRAALKAVRSKGKVA